MKIPCTLKKIENNIATLYDFKNQRDYHVALNEQEVDIYTDLLEELKEYERNNQEFENEDEEISPIVFLDTTREALITVQDENDINLFS